MSYADVLFQCILFRVLQKSASLCLVKFALRSPGCALARHHAEPPFALAAHILHSFPLFLLSIFFEVGYVLIFPLLELSFEIIQPPFMLGLIK